MKKSSLLLVGAVCSSTFALSACGGSSDGGTGSATSPSGAASSSMSSSSPAPSEPSKTTEAAASESSFKDGVLTTPDVRIEITDHKIIPVGQKGNEYGEKPVLALWYKITNVSGGKVSPMNFIFDITAYQDNNPNAENKLDVGMLPDDRFTDSQTENIKKGGTVESAIAYELDDTTTPVDLVASDDLGMTEIGKVSYPLK